VKSPAETTVLVVDDEESLREVLEFEFQRRGYRVLTAASGNEAFALACEHPIDVVVSDVRMPDGSGVDLLRRLKERDVRLPVIIFVTAYSDLPTEQAYDMGVEAIISKPFAARDLLAAVARALQPFDERWREEASTEPPSTELAVALDTPDMAQQVLRIGRGGLFVASVTPPAVGVRVAIDVAFSAEPEAALMGTGIVRWRRTETTEARPPGVGVELLTLSEASRRHWVPRFSASRTRAYIPLG
jgi:CheY-like chemotaxis protein/Tfp pilus assembly protein PilZ